MKLIVQTKTSLKNTLGLNFISFIKHISTLRNIEKKFNLASI